MDNPPSQQIVSKSTVLLHMQRVFIKSEAGSLSWTRMSHFQAAEIRNINVNQHIGSTTSSSLQSSSLKHPSYFLTHNSRNGSVCRP